MIKYLLGGGAEVVTSLNCQIWVFRVEQFHAGTGSNNLEICALYYYFDG
jgi:hypothetical protein